MPTSSRPWTPTTSRPRCGRRWTGPSSRRSASQTSPASAAKEAGLTERELVIVRAVARGLSNEAIAKELWVAEQTVKFHLTNIYRKLEVSNRTEAARYAFEQGLVEHGADGPTG